MPFRDSINRLLRPLPFLLKLDSVGGICLIYLYLHSQCETRKRTNMVWEHLKVSVRGTRLGTSFTDITGATYSFSLFLLTPAPLKFWLPRPNKTPTLSQFAFKAVYLSHSRIQALNQYANF